MNTALTPDVLAAARLLRGPHLIVAALGVGLIGLGVYYVLRPDQAVLDQDYQRTHGFTRRSRPPGRRTLRVYQVIGAFFAVCGVAFIVGAIVR